jgi:hypothetical protein
MKYFIGSILFIFVFSFKSNAQVPDPVAYRKNSIRIEATSALIYRNAFVFSYERMIKQNQSIIITAGYQELPGLSGYADSIKAIKQGSNTGYKFGAEYRFYLAKENKYASPHGLYVGPYFSTTGFNNATDVTINSGGLLESGTINSNIRIYNIGFEMGYQFALSNRWNLDLVFAGPSVSNYDIKSKLNGNFTFDPSNIENEALQKVMNKFPGLKNLFENETVSSAGRLKKWGVGFRYQLNIAYRFGKKK